MKKTIWLLISVAVMFVVIGCAEYDKGNEESRDNTNSQPINYETQQEQEKRQGSEKKQTDDQDMFPDNNYKNVNEGDDHAQSDKFTNEMSQSISNQLKQRRDVRQAQVAVSEDRVVVGVMLTDQAPPDMRELVEQEVQEMVPDKDVYVYTDDIYWDRMRNEDAKLDQLNGDMREFLREFFNRDRENF